MKSIVRSMRSELSIRGDRIRSQLRSDETSEVTSSNRITQSIYFYTPMIDFLTDVTPVLPTSSINNIKNVVVFFKKYGYEMVILTTF